MNLHIMTWNCGLYREKPSSPNLERYNSIVNFVRGRLELENSMVVLQEIPYKSNEDWNVHPFYQKLLGDFQNDKYKMVFSESNKNQIMMTVAIALKDKIEPLGDDYYPVNNKPKNRAVAVKFNGISFLGIHAENGNNNKSYLTSLHGKADIILGDFNAGDYLESENRSTFNRILKEHICICNMPTKVTENGRRTCIDHVFIRENMVTGCSNLIVHEDISFSDHFPITFEISI